MKKRHSGYLIVKNKRLHLSKKYYWASSRNKKRLADFMRKEVKNISMFPLYDDDIISFRILRYKK